LLRVSRLTVLDLIYKGEIEAFAIGSSWRITGTALNAYINENMERLKEAVSGRKNKGTN
jgi:excisionase family DNA binding protein